MIPACVKLAKPSQKPSRITQELWCVSRRNQIRERTLLCLSKPIFVFPLQNLEIKRKPKCYPHIGSIYPYKWKGWKVKLNKWRTQPLKCARPISTGFPVCLGGQRHSDVTNSSSLANNLSFPWAHPMSEGRSLNNVPNSGNKNIRNPSWVGEHVYTSYLLS